MDYFNPSPKYDLILTLVPVCVGLGLTDKPVSVALWRQLMVSDDYLKQSLNHYIFASHMHNESDSCQTKTEIPL